MTETAEGAGSGPTADADPFVTQVCWLVAVAGGKDQLVARCGGLVSARTLDNWTAGNYPRTKVTGAVRDLDAWARAHLPSYPAAADAPSLVESCGPLRRPPAPLTTAPSLPGDDGAGAAPGETDLTGPSAQGDEPGPVSRRLWLRRGWWGPALVGVLAVAVTATVIVVLRDPGEDATSSDEAAAQSLVNLPLPSTGDGTSYTELSGSIGANTFADPRTLQDRGAEIPANTEIQVRCRYYAPSVPSVSPDGFWYLIETDQWNGRWTPANSFMNGDVPGGPYIHNTDFAVPVCR